jgi:hypothetical protein
VIHPLLPLQKIQSWRRAPADAAQDGLHTRCFLIGQPVFEWLQAQASTARRATSPKVFEARFQVIKAASRLVSMVFCK